MENVGMAQDMLIWEWLKIRSCSFLGIIWPSNFRGISNFDPYPDGYLSMFFLCVVRLQAKKNISSDFTSYMAGNIRCWKIGWDLADVCNNFVYFVYSMSQWSVPILTTEMTIYSETWECDVAMLDYNPFNLRELIRWYRDTLSRKCMIQWYNSLS
jgi:hypothetical protein